MRGIDGIIYINLDLRTDRRSLIESEFRRLSIPEEKIHRFSGILDRLNGVRGALMSHMCALEMAQEKGWKRVLILEDDGFFRSTKEEIEADLDRFFQEKGDNWDILFLGGLYLEKGADSCPGVMQIHHGLCAHAYIIHHSYLQPLKEVFLEALEKIKSDLFNTHSTSHALDREWVPLQRKDRWFAFDRHHVMQRMLPSDIDIVNTPMNRFDEIICIDQGNKENLREEFVRFGISIEDLYWVTSHKESVQLAKKLKCKRYLIVEDTAKLPKDANQLDLHILHFFRWRAREWDLFLFESDQCEKTTSEHFFYHKVTKIFFPKCYIVSDLILDRLLDHFTHHQGLDSLEIKPEMAVFCSP